jgi:hypothetical protein
MKKILVIVLTALIFLSAAFIGVANVYRVDGVVLDAKMFSEAAKAEAAAMQIDLQTAYEGESSLFAKETAAKEVIEKYPYFRLTKFEKRYPNLLVVEATEDMEVFAVQSGEEYYILSEDGTVLDVRADLNNRVDGEANIVITGAFPSGEVGEIVQGAGFAETLRICAIMSDRLNGVRSNIDRIEFDGVEGGGRIFLCMREGVKICLVHAHLLTEEKAVALTEAYLSMEVEQRLTGFLHVTESLDGTEVLIKYQANLLD